jgi:hypothetical protein
LTFFELFEPWDLESGTGAILLGFGEAAASTGFWDLGRVTTRSSGVFFAARAVAAIFPAPGETAAGDGLDNLGPAFDSRPRANARVSIPRLELRLASRAERLSFTSR